MKRDTSPHERKVFAYLNKLRESGKTNMFGARPYIMKKFGMEADDAKELLMIWMKNFDPSGEYKQIEIKETA